MGGVCLCFTYQPAQGDVVNLPEPLAVPYLDFAATTPVDPRVADVVMHYMAVDFGNAGSRTHEYGSRAKKAVDLARELVADVVKARPDEVIFTSGATEANNLAILGLTQYGLESGRKHIISTQIEHKAVLEPLAEMERRGFEVTLLPPNLGGWVEPELLSDALRDDTLLVSIMHVNNELGVIQPVEDVAALLANHPAYLHTDAAQGFAKDFEPLVHPRVDLISCSAHKVFGPKGVGALVARRRRRERVPLTPLIFGGGQERGLRPGTSPVPLVAGFGEAVRLALAERTPRAAHCGALDKELSTALQKQHAILLGDPARRLGNIAAYHLGELDSEAAILRLRHLAAVSNGSACTSTEIAPSHVLQAMYPSCAPPGVVRFSWSHLTPVDAVAAIGAGFADD